jgi:DNA-binding GntR family transcriptional regulator
MKKWIRTRIEVAFIRLARSILIGRNTNRSPVVSRRDNNEMWSMAERLEGIEARMLNNYKSQ